jgi:hypothetical protein
MVGGTVPVPPGVKMTPRLRCALEHIAARQPVTNDELGARLHEFKRDGGKPWGHARDNRCKFCHDEGRSAGSSLRSKRLVVWKKNRGWCLVGYKPGRARTGGPTGLPDDF